ncbi:hypothetical protein E2I00_007000 [Balaenoptera physalus]|uniref:Kinase n=1 Tax=Balaenoptera physalus TaxID=9770 RepID=A0A6A1Q875_BALPH|nr:hypothetical protein E2I00_007000 [Balaenoptera physalus]
MGGATPCSRGKRAYADANLQTGTVSLSEKPLAEDPDHGSFKAAGTSGLILKRSSEPERYCLARLMADALRGCVPAFHGVVERDGESYLQLQDLLDGFDGPCKADGSCSTDFKTTRSREQVIRVFEEFVQGDAEVLRRYLNRLQQIRDTLEVSEFFRRHEVRGVGSGTVSVVCEGIGLEGFSGLEL